MSGWTVSVSFLVPSTTQVFSRLFFSRTQVMFAADSGQDRVKYMYYVLYLVHNAPAGIFPHFNKYTTSVFIQMGPLTLGMFLINDVLVVLVK